MPGTPHIGCKRGKRVIVTLRNGTRVRDVFEHCNEKFVFLKEYGRIEKVDIRAFQIDRNPAKV